MSTRKTPVRSRSARLKKKEEEKLEQQQQEEEQQETTSYKTPVRPRKKKSAPKLIVGELDEEPMPKKRKTKKSNSDVVKTPTTRSNKQVIDTQVAFEKNKNSRNSRIRTRGKKSQQQEEEEVNITRTDLDETIQPNDDDLEKTVLEEESDLATKMDEIPTDEETGDITRTPYQTPKKIEKQSANVDDNDDLNSTKGNDSILDELPGDVNISKNEDVATLNESKNEEELIHGEETNFEKTPHENGTKDEEEIESTEKEQEKVEKEETQIDEENSEPSQANEQELQVQEEENEPTQDEEETKQNETASPLKEQISTDEMFVEVEDFIEQEELYEKQRKEKVACSKIITCLQDFQENKKMKEIQAHENPIIIQSYFRDLQFLQTIELVRKKNKAAILIQTISRSYLAKKELNKRRKHKENIQRLIGIIRGQIIINFLFELKNSVKTIQSAGRGYLVSQEFKGLKQQHVLKCILEIQSSCRQNLVQKSFKKLIEEKKEKKLQEKRNFAAILIQKEFRRYKIRNEFKSMRSSIIRLQCFFRKKWAKREFKRREKELDEKLKEKESSLFSFQTHWNSLKNYGYNLLFGTQEKEKEELELKRKYEEKIRKLENASKGLSEFSKVEEKITKKKKELKLVEKENEVLRDLHKQSSLIDPNIKFLATPRKQSSSIYEPPSAIEQMASLLDTKSIFKFSATPVKRNPKFQNYKNLSNNFKERSTNDSTMNTSIDEFQFTTPTPKKRKLQNVETSSKKMRMDPNASMTKPPRYPTNDGDVVMVKPVPTRPKIKKKSSLMDDTVIDE